MKPLPDLSKLRMMTVGLNGAFVPAVPGASEQFMNTRPPNPVTTSLDTTVKALTKAQERRARKGSPKRSAPEDEEVDDTGSQSSKKVAQEQVGQGDMDGAEDVREDIAEAGQDESMEEDETEYTEEELKEWAEQEAARMNEGGGDADI